MRNKSILVFGGGELQKSLIELCKNNDLNTIVIDPDPNALCKDLADTFLVVGGDDLKHTCEIIQTFSIDGIVTTATDKPLKMMSKIAAKYGFPFISENTAKLTTNKSLMKQAFVENNLPCADGKNITHPLQISTFPCLIKPADSSGSRGVQFCKDSFDAAIAFENALKNSTQNYVICEEYIPGTEFSVEALHFEGQTKILQITEKTVTPFPYFVEISHVQPASIPHTIFNSITLLTEKIAHVFGFHHCASHNEFKINEQGIYIIEVSPRAGGDKISSHLVPLSTGINMEQAIIDIAMGHSPEISQPTHKASGIFYFQLDDEYFPDVNATLLNSNDHIVEKHIPFKTGDRVPLITSSLNRYGHIILKANNRSQLLKEKEQTWNLLFKTMNS